MNTYAERLAWAMKCAGLDPHTDQSELARRVGHGCKPQNIQHLLDPNKNARSSKYTVRLAEVLNCDVNWLAYGGPNKPKVRSTPPKAGDNPVTTEAYNEPSSAPQPTPLSYPADTAKFRRVFVVGRATGGLPDRIWTDGDYPVGATDQYAEIASPDPHAFLTPVVGTSMVPRFNPGEFALVEPGTEPEIEDDVLVRLATGETMIKRLLSRRAGLRLGSYNDPQVLTYDLEDVTWVYYIAHPVPARKIKTRL
ncbi:helix-turn-helix transcriptional regulator [Cupriavidus sp. 2TAF22]|uniref:S24 family peptidase n=1 Tax=unclassified Cupriavidus TaxID=2640874 RepID=UPI003F929F78